jgi:hypothetical protein
VSEQRNQTEEQANAGREERAKGAVTLLIGRILCILGILTAVGGTIVAFAVDSTDITAGAAAIFLGVVGYILGERRLGALTVVLGVVALLVLLGAASGLSEGR